MNKCTFGVGKNRNKYVFDSGSVPVPNRFEPVPKFIFSLEPQPKKRFGSTEKWNHNHNHRFGFGLNRFPTVPEPDRGSTKYYDLEISACGEMDRPRSGRAGWVTNREPDFIFGQLT